MLNLEGEVEDVIEISDYASVTVDKASIATFGYSNTTGNPVAMFTAGSFNSDPLEFYHVGVDVVTKELMYWVR